MLNVVGNSHHRLAMGLISSTVYYKYLIVDMIVNYYAKKNKAL